MKQLADYTDDELVDLVQLIHTHANVYSPRNSLGHQLRNACNVLQNKPMIRPFEFSNERKIVEKMLAPSRFYFVVYDEVMKRVTPPIPLTAYHMLVLTEIVGTTIENQITMTIDWLYINSKIPDQDVIEELFEARTFEISSHSEIILTSEGQKLFDQFSK